MLSIRKRRTVRAVRYRSVGVLRVSVCLCFMVIIKGRYRAPLGRRRLPQPHRYTHTHARSTSDTTIDNGLGRARDPDQYLLADLFEAKLHKRDYGIIDACSVAIWCDCATYGPHSDAVLCVKG